MVIPVFEENWAPLVHLVKEDLPVTLVDEEARVKMDLRVLVVLQAQLATKAYQALAV